MSFFNFGSFKRITHKVHMNNAPNIKICFWDKVLKNKQKIGAHRDL
jgi:hypothetical protein